MTPQYVAVREDWTVAQVLDYIRLHGEDSETLNVIYVVDDRGVLIDDIRSDRCCWRRRRRCVARSMDRRFIALKATDDQETAVALSAMNRRSMTPRNGSPRRQRPRSDSRCR